MTPEEWEKLGRIVNTLRNTEAKYAEVETDGFEVAVTRIDANGFDLSVTRPNGNM